MPKAMKRIYSTIGYMNLRAKETRPRMVFEGENPQAFHRWQRRFRERLLQLLGDFPRRTPLRPETLQREELKDHFREKVVYQAEPTASVPAYVLIPKDLKPGERRPGLLALHGHGRGKEDVVGIDHGNEEIKKHIQSHNYDYARKLVRQGFITITPDFRCFGERSDGEAPYGKRDKCNVNFIKGSLLGVNLLALNIWDVMRTIDYFSRRAEVDQGRIGCLGLSFGGTMTLYAAALDERIRVAVVSCYLTTFDAYAIRKGNFCGSQFVPGLMRYGDVADVARLIAPRPLLIESGIKDKGFPIAASRKAYRYLRRAYDILGASRRIAFDQFDAGHQFSGRKAFAWFDKWL